MPDDSTQTVHTQTKHKAGLRWIVTLVILGLFMLVTYVALMWEEAIRGIIGGEEKLLEAPAFSQRADEVLPPIIDVGTPQVGEIETEAWPPKYDDISVGSEAAIAFDRQPIYERIQTTDRDLLIALIHSQSRLGSAHTIASLERAHEDAMSQGRASSTIDAIVTALASAKQNAALVDEALFSIERLSSAVIASPLPQRDEQAVDSPNDTVYVGVVTEEEGFLNTVKQSFDNVVSIRRVEDPSTSNTSQPQTNDSRIHLLLHLERAAQSLQIHNLPGFHSALDRAQEFLSASYATENRTALDMKTKLDSLRAIPFEPTDHLILDAMQQLEHSYAADANPPTDVQP